MKPCSWLLVLSLCLMSCATTTRLANKAMRNGLVGQDEYTVEARLGVPVEVIFYASGEKDLIYAYYSHVRELPGDIESKNFLLDENSRGTELASFFIMGLLTYHPNDANYEIQTNYLDVYLDAEGYCVGFDHNLTKEQLKILGEQFSHYAP
ncbi:hypothetical protein [Mangrovibacterium lignilyticum]|uniref:hypothetical protein n=1 Tax=Mangrovibacterium lignilyticum TaxID=2668052 RepID=UPI0013D6A8E7|nr:hypothetical protein [Mangrovibacterium lignilyticum]